MRSVDGGRAVRAPSALCDHSSTVEHGRAKLEIRVRFAVIAPGFRLRRNARVRTTPHINRCREARVFEKLVASLLRSGAEAARLAHAQEVARAIRASATTSRVLRWDAGPTVNRLRTLAGFDS